jgi:ribosomal protein S18 acetylase RimI-like enzyme
MQMIDDISTVIIRKIEYGEIDKLVYHRINYLLEMQGDRSDEYIVALKSELSSFFQKSLIDKSFWGLVALYEGQEVAYAGMIVSQIPGDFNRATYSEGAILNVYTIPSARRQGISMLILKKLLIESKLMGITKVSLHSSDAGKALYQSLGFKTSTYPYLELSIVD